MKTSVAGLSTGTAGGIEACLTSAGTVHSIAWPLTERVDVLAGQMNGLIGAREPWIEGADSGFSNGMSTSCTGVLAFASG